MNIYTFLVLINLKIMYIYAKPTNTMSVYEKIQELAERDDYKCPYLRNSLLVTSNLTFLKDCPSFIKAENISEINTYTLLDAQCMIYFDTFTNVCNKLSNPNVGDISIPNATNEIRVEDVCASLNRHAETKSAMETNASRVIKKYISVLSQCERFCTNYNNHVENACILSSMLVNIVPKLNVEVVTATTSKVKPILTALEYPSSGNENVHNHKTSSDISIQLHQVKTIKPENVGLSTTVKGIPYQDQNQIDQTDNVASVPVSTSVQQNLENKSTEKNKHQEPTMEEELQTEKNQHRDSKEDNPTVEEVTPKVLERKSNITQTPQPSLVNNVKTSDTKTQVSDDHENPVGHPKLPANEVEDVPSNNMHETSHENGPKLQEETGNSITAPQTQNIENPQEADNAHIEEEGYNFNDEEAEVPADSNKFRETEKSKPLETNEDNANYVANAPNQNMSEDDSYFFSYFMMVCIVFILGYVGYHNKQKILALVLEGRKGKRHQRRRPNSANYHKLDCNLEEAVTSSCNKNTTNIIY